MRWAYLIIIVLFVVAVAVFAVQNLDMATMSFLGFSIHAPLAVLAAVVYLLGAATGGSLFALLRKSMQETRARHSA
jgi:putative membrane protein